MKAISGTLAQCLEHYRDETGVEGLKILVGLAHATTLTIRRWYKATSQSGPLLDSGSFRGLPTGDNLASVRSWLDLLGYRIHEFVELPEPAQQLTRVIGFRIANAEELRSKLGYATPQAVYKVALRGGGLHFDRVGQLEKLLDEYRPELTRVMGTWRSKLGDIEPADPIVPDEPGLVAMAVPRLPLESEKALPSVLMDESTGLLDERTLIKLAVQAVDSLDVLVAALGRSPRETLLRNEVTRRVGAGRLRELTKNLIDFAE